jgi:hypothetical protein
MCLLKIHRKPLDHFADSSTTLPHFHSSTPTRRHLTQRLQTNKMPTGPLSDAEEKLLLLLIVDLDVTVSRAKFAEIGKRMDRNPDVIRLVANTPLANTPLAVFTTRMSFLLPPFPSSRAHTFSTWLPRTLLCASFAQPVPQFAPSSERPTRLPHPQKAVAYHARHTDVRCGGQGHVVRCPWSSRSRHARPIRRDRDSNEPRA